MRRTLGLVTIGQSPRTDLTSDLADELTEVHYVEHGALDKLSSAEVESLRPEPGETPLTSRMKDGSNVVITHRHLHPLLEHAVQECADDGAEAVLILCTGHMPPISSTILVHYAEELAHSSAAKLVGNKRLGTINPMADQVTEAVARWHEALPGTVIGDHANPYTGTRHDVEKAARRLAARGAEVLFLDCIGYTTEMQQAASHVSALPVLLPRSLAVRHVVNSLTPGHPSPSNS